MGTMCGWEMREVIPILNVILFWEPAILDFGISGKQFQKVKNRTFLMYLLVPKIKSRTIDQALQYTFSHFWEICHILTWFLSIFWSRKLNLIANINYNQISRKLSKKLKKFCFWACFVKLYLNIFDSWHELGYYDLPAVINYITELRNKTLHFIGHSMGATTFSVMAIERPELQLKIRTMIALAPAVYVNHLKGPLRLLARFRREIKVIFQTSTFLLWRIKTFFHQIIWHV